jgi:DNA-binding transcriptional regulator YiaG
MTPAEIRAAREALGMTQEGMARALLVTPRAVQMWEAGDRTVPGPAIVALGLMLRVPRARWPSERSTATDRGTQAG